MPFIKHTVAVKVSFPESKTVKNYNKAFKGDPKQRCNILHENAKKLTHKMSICKLFFLIIRIIMAIYHALINALSAHMIHINLNIFYTHIEHSPTKRFT